MDRTEFEKKYVIARRNAIGLDFIHLNAIQREAVMITQGPLLLLAGAGSGKTTVLINRIANLLRYGCGSDSEYVPEGATEEDLSFLETYIAGKAQGSGYTEPETQFDEIKERINELCAVSPVEPWRIIAITFTNKAAAELKQRLSKMLGPGSEDIWASTFHSACVRILRRDIDRLGYERSFAIYDTADSASLMKRILKDLDVEERLLPHKTALGYISRAKDAMIPADEFLSSAEKNGDMRRMIIGRAFLEYETRLKSSNALDFDDLILLTVKLFQENSDILLHYQRRFKYVLVDEYQDTNNLQYLLVAALAGGHSNICVVGDDDQSIYKFRGATIENILNFEKRFDDARTIRLEQNYRSTSYILSAANDVIRNNKGRKGKKLWTENIPGHKPELHIISDERAEAQFVSDTIMASVSEGRGWSQHAVLYRMNAQSNQFETAFKRSGIPYRIYGGIGFYERAEIKDMLAYLCVIHNPHDDVRLLRVINNPPRGIGATTVGRLSALAAELGISVYAAIEHSHKRAEFHASSARLHQFADMIAELSALSENAPLDELYDSLIARTGYVRMLEVKNLDENIARIENVRELKTNIISFMKENGGTLFDFLGEIALFTDLDRDDESVDRVLLMTMHSAKGLEFDSVFIAGAEEGIFPGMRAIGEPGEIEEERRLCYVAMTRAMRKLYFMSARNRMLFGKTSSAQPSRFIEEIGSENIDVHKPRFTFQEYDFTGSYYRNNQPSPLPAQTQPPNPRETQPAAPARASQHQFSTPSPPHPIMSASHPTSHAPFSPEGSPHSTSSSPRSTQNTPLSIPGASAQPLPEFMKGDTVDHKAFGRGMITDISRAGGDALLEIAFDDVGTKRMLLKSASRYIRKVVNE